MTRIFISYSRLDKPVAARLAERLTEAGYDVWWDAELVGGQRFEEEIQAALKAANAVLVLWSHASTASDWVRAEAEMARVARAAVPVLIDDVTLEALPLVFRALHTIDLRNWNGDPAAAGFRDILSAVGKLSSTLPQPRPPIASHYPPTGARAASRRRLPIVAIGATAVVLAAIVAGLAWWQLRPAADACPASDIVALASVPLTLCIGSKWSAAVDNSEASREYRQGGAIVRIIPASDVIALPDIRDRILATARRIAGDPDKIAIVREGEQAIAGKTWRLVEFTNAGIADFVDYYYSAEGFGSIHIQIVSSIATTARRNALVAPLFASIRFID